MQGVVRVFVFSRKKLKSNHRKMINFNSFILFIVFIITLVHFTNAKEVIALKVPSGSDAFSFDSLLWQDDNVETHTMEDVGGAEVGLKAPRDKIDFSASFQVLIKFEKR